MAEEDKEFSHESFQDRETIVRYLSALCEGLHEGRLRLASNGDSMTLDTPQLVKLDVEAKQKRSRGQLVLKLSWKAPRSMKELRFEPLTICSDNAAANA